MEGFRRVWNGLKWIGDDSEGKIVKKMGFCVQTMVWNRLGMIRKGRSSEKWVSAFERSNVGNCRWLADDERSNFPPELSNVGMFRRMTWNDQEFERASQAFKRLGLRVIGLEA